MIAIIKLYNIQAFTSMKRIFKNIKITTERNNKEKNYQVVASSSLFQVFVCEVNWPFAT